MAGFVKWIPGQPLQNFLPRNRSAAFWNWNLKSLYQTEKNDKIPASWPLQLKPSCVSLRLVCANLRNLQPGSTAKFPSSEQICRLFEFHFQNLPLFGIGISKACIKQRKMIKFRPAGRCSRNQAASPVLGLRKLAQPAARFYYKSPFQ
ncbi:MAG: hypothetical protein ACI4IA_01120 [Acutalibacteraceae bacterium]